MLAALVHQQEEAAERSAKRQRVADGMGDRLDDPEDIKALSQLYRSGPAMAHQAELWNVSTGKTKAATTQKIIAAIQASQNPGGEQPEGDDNHDGDDDEDDDDDERGIV